MKIAYLIAAHDNFLHLKRLIQALDGPGVTFYLHIDRKSPMPMISGKNIYYVTKRVNVHWSGFSQVRATLKLLQSAFPGEYDYYAYISGTDYPIKPNSWLTELLAGGGEFINIFKMGQDPYAPMSRYRYFYFTDCYNRRNKHSRKTRFFLWFQQVLRKLRIRKSIPYSIYTGASWFVLSHACVAYILLQVRKDRKLKRFFRTGFCPDEAFFQTIIGNSPFLSMVKGYLTYADWSVDPGPAWMHEHHLSVLSDSKDKFFARKFSDQSSEIVNIIDRTLRSEKIG